MCGVSFVADGELVVAGGHGPVALEPADAAFDRVALLIAFGVERGRAAARAGCLSRGCPLPRPRAGAEHRDGPDHGTLWARAARRARWRWGMDGFPPGHACDRSRSMSATPRSGCITLRSSAGFSVTTSSSVGNTC